jgi:hypothetical protein
MPAFKVDSADDGIDWPNINDPAAWELVVDGVSALFLLDPDPELDDEAAVDIAADGWIATIATQVVEEVPDRYQDNPDGNTYLGRAAFVDAMERLVDQRPLRQSAVTAMLTYAGEERQAALDKATKRNVGKARGAHTRRR